jgi:glycerol-3-phosphate dehydrogenase subunit C
MSQVANLMQADAPEEIAHKVLKVCAGCDQCRELFDAPCQFFPRLFVLADRIKARGAMPTSREWQDMIDLCNSCGQCPCGPIQTQIRQAKDAFVNRDGLPYAVRFIEDVQLVGKLCGMLPRLTNSLMRVKPVAGAIKAAIGVHPERKFPEIPDESFDVWAKREGLTEMKSCEGRKVAYFVGCTARYLFPKVAIATVRVLQANGIPVYVPPQKCCGMPTYLEGDRPFAYRLAAENLPVLKSCIDAGYEIVTACPTCSFAFKTVLARGATFASSRRAKVRKLMEEESGDVARVKTRLEAEALAPTGRANSTAATFHQTWVLNHIATHRHAGEGVDDGYYSELDANLRIDVASHCWELGEYLRDLARTGDFKLPAAITGEKLAYFPPCHLREQNMGQPWRELLGNMPGSDLTTVGNADDCCGLGGVMGYKKNFHSASLAMGRGLMDRTAAAGPDRVVTECLGCRVQFQQMLPYPVKHPVEILADAVCEASTE